MNERIKELAEQVGFRPYYDTGTGEVDADGQAVTLPNWSASDPWVSKCQKFAELIVRECMKEIKDMIVDESELLYPNNKQTTECVNNRLMDAHDNISELFGVE